MQRMYTMNFHWFRMSPRICRVKRTHLWQKSRGVKQPSITLWIHQEGILFQYRSGKWFPLCKKTLTQIVHTMDKVFKETNQKTWVLSFKFLKINCESNLKTSEKMIYLIILLYCLRSISLALQLQTYWRKKWGKK